MPAHRSRLVPARASDALAQSLTALRGELGLPAGFPPEVLAEADAAARDVPTDPHTAGLDDLRELPFLSIDPAGSRDLDQAMHLERTASGAVLHYAIADVAAYVRPGGAVDAEARERGQTFYAADGRIPLHPPVLSEDAASLLPGHDRRAYVWRFELDERAEPVRTSLRPAVIRSRRAWSYPAAQAAVDAGTAPATLRALPWFGAQRALRESERGGASLNMPATEIVVDDGRYRLEREAAPPIEDWNAHVSLLTGMAAARLMLDGGIGILRTMPAADAVDIAAFRERTVVLGLPWRPDERYGDYLRRLDREDPAALAVREAAASLFRGASYSAFDGGPPAEILQAAIGAPYAHATAPLRRLVDRFSLVVCAAIAAGDAVPDWARTSLPALPRIMARSDQRAGALDAGSIDRVEAALLHGREGTVFPAVVLGDHGTRTRVQLTDPPLTATVTEPTAEPGATVRLRLQSTDIATGQVVLVPVEVSPGTSS